MLTFLALLLPVSTSAQVDRYPEYAFADWRYWLFVTLYAAISIRIITWVARAAPYQSQERTGKKTNVSLEATLVFAIAVTCQIFHQFEHVTQMYQWWYLGMPGTVSQGVVFFLDLEWNHFIFDSTYFLLLFVGTILLIRHCWRHGGNIDRFGGFLLLAMNMVQAWHAIEHTYRLVHHVQTGCQPCSGIVDSLTGVPLIPLHFWYNVFATTLPLMCIWWFGMHKRLLRLIYRSS